MTIPLAYLLKGGQNFRIGASKNYEGYAVPDGSLLILKPSDAAVISNPKFLKIMNLENNKGSGQRDEDVSPYYYNVSKFFSDLYVIDPTSDLNDDQENFRFLLDSFNFTGFYESADAFIKAYEN